MGKVDVRVIPRSPKNAIEGPRGGRLVVRVTAPPVDDKANDAVLKLVAEMLRVAKSAVTITAGSTSRNKSLSIAGLSDEEIALRLMR